MTDCLYQLDRVTHSYGEKKVVDIQTLSIPRASITGLSGANGSGKSTLLKLMAFAMSPTRGEIRFNGRKELPQSPRVRSRVTLLTQTPYLLKRSVFDNVAYGLKIRKDRIRVNQRVEQALNSVGLHPKDFSQRLWHELSGGEAQRVAMAARLILKPQALLLDEPVASVDASSAALIRQASMSARNEWGCTLIIVSHDLAWLHEVSDNRISMAGGQIFATGKESVIPGPYTRDKNGWLIKDLENGEFLVLSQGRSAHDGKTAVLKKERVQLFGTRNQSEGSENQATALVTHMLHEKKTDLILTTLAMKGFTLTLSLTQNQASVLNLTPGKSIALIFRPEDISWR